MKLLKEYFELQKKIYEYFGYVEDWKVIPLDDCTEMFWTLDQSSDGSGEVKYAESLEQLQSDGDYYSNEIYTQRFLPKFVYEGKEYTMVCVDTHTDGNKFLQVFTNEKKVEA